MKKTEVNYSLLCRQLEGFMETDPYWLPVLSNAAALLYEALPCVNWAGFYLVDDGVKCPLVPADPGSPEADGDMENTRDEKQNSTAGLVLGPFQGKTACIRIARGKGVCGTALEQDRVQVVPDVHAFPGHIACDSASRSEIVLPLHVCQRESSPLAEQNTSNAVSKGIGPVFGVLDIDSPEPDRFSEADREGLMQFVKILEAGIELR